MRTSKPLFCLHDQRLGCRRSRCDNTFKGSGEPVERQGQTILSWFAFMFVIVLTTVIHCWRTRVSPRWYFPCRRRLVLCYILQEGAIQLSIRNCRLDAFQDIYWGRIHEHIYWRICWIYQPTSKPKYRRVWVPHIGIDISVLQIPFRLEYHGVVKHFRVVHYRPK